VTEVDQKCFEKSGQCYSIYGFEYKPGFDDGYIQWISNNQKSWHITSQALVPDPVAGIGRRPIPQEPMYLIINLGQSPSFTPNISPNIEYPVTMYVDYIRVYQPKGQHNVGCSPKDFPTADYINKCDHLFCIFSSRLTSPSGTSWRTRTRTSRSGASRRTATCGGTTKRNQGTASSASADRCCGLIATCTPPSFTLSTYSYLVHVHTLLVALLSLPASRSRSRTLRSSIRLLTYITDTLFPMHTYRTVRACCFVINLSAVSL
jgi:hypothetical protein